MTNTSPEYSAMFCFTDVGQEWGVGEEENAVFSRNFKEVSCALKTQKTHIYAIQIIKYLVFPVQNCSKSENGICHFTCPIFHSNIIIFMQAETWKTDSSLIYRRWWAE